MSAPEPMKAPWRKSSRSNGSGGACVEIAGTSGAVLVRDSKRPADAALSFAASDWTLFLRDVKSGRHDLV